MKARACGIGMKPQRAISPYGQLAPPMLGSRKLLRPPPMMPLHAKAMAPKQRGYGGAAMPSSKLHYFEENSKASSSGHA